MPSYYSKGDSIFQSHFYVAPDSANRMAYFVRPDSNNPQAVALSGVANGWTAYQSLIAAAALGYPSAVIGVTARMPKLSNLGHRNILIGYRAGGAGSDQRTVRLVGLAQHVVTDSWGNNGHRLILPPMPVAAGAVMENRIQADTAQSDTISMFHLLARTDWLTYRADLAKVGPSPSPTRLTQAPTRLAPATAGGVQTTSGSGIYGAYAEVLSAAANGSGEKVLTAVSLRGNQSDDGMVQLAIGASGAEVPFAELPFPYENNVYMPITWVLPWPIAFAGNTRIAARSRQGSTTTTGTLVGLEYYAVSDL